jgi:hypothetical protein
MVLVKDERVGCFIWLLCAAGIAALGFWYPEHVANRNAAPDDRFGFVLMAGMPFYSLGGIIAVRAMIGLVAIARPRQTRSAQLLLFAGALMTVFSLTPLFIIGSRLFLRR